MTATDDQRVRSGIEEALNEDRRKTIDEVAYHFGVSHRTVYCIITNDLKMTKVSARWVPTFEWTRQANARSNGETFSWTLRTGRRAFLAEHHYMWWIMAPFLWYGDKSGLNGLGDMKNASRRGGEYFEKNWKTAMTSFRSKCPACTMVYDLNIFFKHILCMPVV